MHQKCLSTTIILPEESTRQQWSWGDRVDISVLLVDGAPGLHDVTPGGWGEVHEILLTATWGSTG